MRLKLYHAPRSPFAVKVRILIHEVGLKHRVALVPIDPWTDEGLRAINPLCKVPTLLLENGHALYDSRVICEYLDVLAGGGLVPPSGPHRWQALAQQALADGLAEAVIRRFVERQTPANERSLTVIARQEAAVAAALDALEANATEARLRAAGTITIGEVAATAALAYLDRRSPEIVWRDGRASLAAWYATISKRPATVAAALA